MPSTLVQWIMLCAPVPLATAGLVGAVRWRHLGPSMRWLTGLVWFGLLMELVSRWMMLQKMPNLILSPLDTLAEFVGLTWIYGRELRPWPITRYVPAAIGLFAVLTGISIFTQLHSVQFSPVQHSIESITLLVLALLYLYKLSHGTAVRQLEREPMFWVSAGVLLYFAGDVLIFIFSNYLLQQYSRAVNIQVWAVHAVLFMILCSCYTIALWLSPRPSN
ncbi:hypothetical protein [Hymenobacter persicinus]|uniref:Uncharacterized protein n=1 Tax=Hymenobacter persicinus TaxID=2025506 RepID=A0A4Q5L8P1_9BACT|nr:hypothetical protein [Hymenobacter persicinus]RYU78045.1 hypothetical protein EWM57_15485 [Hymenobacter persicinus]